MREADLVDLQPLQREMDAPSTLVRMYNAFQLLFRSAFVIDVAVGLATLWALRVAIQATQKKSRTTKLSGPKSTSLLFEVSRELFESPDMGAMFEAWSKEYGVAYEVPMMAGQKQIMVCDPKAVAYLFARDTWSYVRTPIITAATGRWERDCFGPRASHTEDNEDP